MAKDPRRSSQVIMAISRKAPIGEPWENTAERLLTYRKIDYGGGYTLRRYLRSFVEITEPADLLSRRSSIHTCSLPTLT